MNLYGFLKSDFKFICQLWVLPLSAFRNLYGFFQQHQYIAVSRLVHKFHFWPPIDSISCLDAELWLFRLQFVKMLKVKPMFNK